MKTTDRPDPVILGHVLGEHRELHSAIATVQCLLEKGGRCIQEKCIQEKGASEKTGQALREKSGRVSTPCIDELVAALNVLRCHLADHFAKEELGGFLEEAVARVPRLSKQAAAIMADHPRLLAEIDALIDSIPTTSMEPEAWRSCGGCFDRFASHLVAHERNENAVVQEGYNEDLGLVD